LLSCPLSKVIEPYFLFCLSPCFFSLFSPFNFKAPTNLKLELEKMEENKIGVKAKKKIGKNEKIKIRVQLYLKVDMK
jgi:hypothetical protein